jgi:hypothetical protein
LDIGGAAAGLFDRYAVAHANLGLVGDHHDVVARGEFDGVLHAVQVTLGAAGYQRAGAGADGGVANAPGCAPVSGRRRQSGDTADNGAAAGRRLQVDGLRGNHHAGLDGHGLAGALSRQVVGPGGQQGQDR